MIGVPTTDILVISEHVYVQVNVWFCKKKMQQDFTMLSKTAIVSLSIAIVATIIASTTTATFPARILEAGFYKIYPYQARLKDCNLPGKYNPGEYQIMLRPGRSLDDLSAAISTDIGQYALKPPINTTDIEFEEGSLFFWVRGISDDLLSAIRSYYGIYYIVCHVVQEKAGWDIMREVEGLGDSVPGDEWDLAFRKKHPKYNLFNPLPAHLQPQPDNK
jgi:hypothetical protein